ncbi:MAG: phosphorylase [Ruminococcaceae bacterium]|nr:phosphorylase [Oscillospiraceae bacterium]
MAISKHDFPILEHSSQEKAFINPAPDAEPFPKKCLMTFFEEVLSDFAHTHEGKVIGAYISEMRHFPVFEVTVEGETICMMLASVGAGSIAMQADWLFGQGVETLFVCGSCGVLTDLPEGHVILPDRALRDEGASYHYLAPSRYAYPTAECVEVLARTIEKRGIPYVRTMAWSTDGFYRETPELVEYRKSEGCGVVEMECAALAAVATFRGKKFGQLLYSGDNLADPENYDDRDWYNNTSGRDRLFALTLDGLLNM